MSVIIEYLRDHTWDDICAALVGLGLIGWLTAATMAYEKAKRQR